VSQELIQREQADEADSAAESSRVAGRVAGASELRKTERRAIVRLCARQQKQTGFYEYFKR
jgi:hypothetical protein